MAVLNPVAFLHNRTDHTAQTDRLARSALLSPDNIGLNWMAGVRGYSDCIVAAQGSPNMTVAVAAGQVFVKQATANQGTYVLTNDATVNVAITAAHATLVRNDLIVARVTDSFFAGSTDLGTIEVITGVASGSPVDPTVTGNATVLARIVVAAAATAITAGMITDLRQRVTALGGILPVRTNAARGLLVPYKGMHISNEESGFTERWNGAAWEQLGLVVADTGWVNLVYASGYTAGTPGQLRYRKVGNIVTIAGGATGTLTAGTFVAVNDATTGLLPAAIRPSSTVRNGTNGNSVKMTAVEVRTDGFIYLAGATGMTSLTWASADVTYQVG